MAKKYTYSEAMNDPDLFNNNEPGDYGYESDEERGKSAYGVLADEPSERDSKAQQAAGGENRRGSSNEWGADDGGHLIAARFGGSSGEENLTAQNRNLNRSAYKSMESGWGEHLAAGDKVYVCVETDDPQRPNAYMGFVIYESPDGTRTGETFCFDNESRYEKAGWEEDASETERELEAEGYYSDQIYYPEGPAEEIDMYDVEDEADLISHPSDTEIEADSHESHDAYLGDAAAEEVTDTYGSVNSYENSGAEAGTDPGQEASD